MLTNELEQLRAIKLKFAALGLRANYDHLEEGPIIRSFFFSLGAGNTLAKFIARKDDISMAIGLEHDSVIVKRAGEFLVIEIPFPKDDRQYINLQKCLQEFHNPESLINSMKVPLLLGEDNMGNVAFKDLTEMPHALICGQTGSGKSILQSAIIIGLLYFNFVNKNSDPLEISIIDMKGVDFSKFRQLPNIYNYITSIQNFHETMISLNTEMYRRFKLFSDCSARNLHEYNQLQKQQNKAKILPYKIIVIDELASLIALDYEAYRDIVKKERPYLPAEDVLCSLCQMCRAAGIHVICSTQRASADIISGNIKVNLPVHICLKLPSQIDSRVVLGISGAENLLGKGDMLVQASDSENLERFHSPFVEHKDIEALIEMLKYV